MTLLNPYMNTSNAFAAYFLHIPKPFQQYNLIHNDIWKKKLFYDFDPQLFLVTNSRRAQQSITLSLTRFLEFDAF